MRTCFKVKHLGALAKLITADVYCKYLVDPETGIQSGDLFTIDTCCNTYDWECDIRVNNLKPTGEVTTTGFQSQYWSQLLGLRQWIKIIRLPSPEEGFQIACSTEQVSLLFQTLFPATDLLNAINGRYLD